jgi:hypothetical protein
MKVCIGMHGFRINFHVDESKENLKKSLSSKLKEKHLKTTHTVQKMMALKTTVTKTL